MAARATRKGLARSALGTVGVLLVILYWSTIDRSPHEPAPTSSASDDAHAAWRTQESGVRLGAPYARVGASDVLVVEVTVDAPGDDEIITVRSPAITLLVDGEQVTPWREDKPERRTRGGISGFFASFDGLDIRPGDTITVVLTSPDGSVETFDDVVVQEDHTMTR